MNKNNLAGLIFCFIFFLIGCYNLYVTFKFILKGEMVEGTIVGYNTRHYKSNNVKKVSYAPKVQFYTKNNELITVERSFSQSSEPELYKQLYLYYDKNNPQKILINTFFFKWILPISFICFGLIGILLVLNVMF